MSFNLPGRAPSPGCPACDIPGHSTPGCPQHTLPLADITLSGAMLRLFDFACRHVASQLPPLPNERKPPPAWYVGARPCAAFKGGRYVNLNHWDVILAYLTPYAHLGPLPEPKLRA